MTPMSMTLKLLQPSTTPTMFLPISWTSPFTVASTTVPANLKRDRVGLVLVVLLLVLLGWWGVVGWC